MRRAGGLIVVALLACLAGGSAARADAGDCWTVTARRSVSLSYYQGLTHVGSRLFFVGTFSGGYLTHASDLRRIRGKSQLLPRAVRAVRFNHVGDPSYDPAGGGRLLLALECYYPLSARENACGFGGIGVIDPTTLAWRYWVRLQSTDVPKAMWIEVSPDGQLAWTSSGRDLVAYRTVDISPANAARNRTSRPIRPARRLRGAVPTAGITGGAFAGDRLLLAGGRNGAPEIWSVDLTTGAKTREVRLSNVRAEVEGLDVLPDGTIRWLLTPGVVSRPTYGLGHSTLLTLRPV